MSQSEFLFSDAQCGPEPQSPTGRPGNGKAPKPARRAKARRADANLLPSVFSVTQVTRLIKNVLNEYMPAKVVVEGEISNCKMHSSGHLYLTLKDENAQMVAVMWRSAVERLKFKPADGMAVVATGRVDVYEPQGKYQFYLDKLEPTGVGALELAFRQMAAKLRDEGLFADEHKQPIPVFPATIAIVTSGSGAAVEDIANTLNRRWPVARKLLYPVPVQGEGAAEAIATAIAELNRRAAALGGIDVMIIGRGGGSIEDLWAFNEEVVARAIFASQIPVISGVGHEVDTTIADFVADRRAATPTAAAELAAPVLDEVLDGLRGTQQRLRLAMQRRMQAGGDRVAALAGRGMFVRPLDLVLMKQQQLDEREASLAGALSEQLRWGGRQLEKAGAILRRIEPHVALTRARGQVQEQEHLLRLSVRELGQGKQHRLENLRVQLAATGPRRMVEHERELTGHLADRLSKGIEQSAWRVRQQLTACGQRLENLNPRAVLGRGYSITRDKTTGRIITAQTPPKSGDVMLTELAEETTVESEVLGIRKDNNG